MEGSGGNDDFDLALNVFDEFAYGETVAIGGGDGESFVEGIEVDASKSWTAEVV